MVSDRDFDATHVQICRGLITHHMTREVNVQTVFFFSTELYFFRQTYYMTFFRLNFLWRDFT